MAFNVEYFTLSGTDATNKYVYLESAPVSVLDVAVDTIGGSAQAKDGDFGVDSSRIKWNDASFGLYSILATGDKLRVIYDKS